VSLSAFALGIAVGLGSPTSAGAPARPTPLSYVEVVTGGARPDDALPLVVVLHGRGGSAQRFSQRFGRWDTPARVVFLQGPSRSGDGFAWFERPVRSLDDATFDATLEARVADVFATVEVVRTHRPTAPGPIVLAGYSQGASVALATGMRHPELARDVVIASSWLPARWVDEHESVGGPRVSACHGVADRRLPVSQARSLYSGLARAGYAVELQELPGEGHRLRGRAGTRFFRELRRSVSQQPAPI